MKKKLFKLLGNSWFFHLMIIVIFFPVFYWGLDARIGMMLFGALIILVSVVQYLEVNKENPRLEGQQASFIGANRVGCLGRAQKALSGFFIVFGVFMILAMILFFVRGETLDTGR